MKTAKELTPFAEDEQLIVGKYYNVKCAIVQVYGKDRLVPIIGILHKDAQFDFVKEHYHIDGRFTSGRGNPYDTNSLGHTNGVVTTDNSNVNSDNGNNTFKGIIVKRMKCKRLTTGLSYIPPASKVMKWKRTMIGKSCKGRKCPHLGVHMHERDGVLYCPLHGLRGDIVKEVIIER